MKKRVGLHPKNNQEPRNQEANDLIRLWHYRVYRQWTFRGLEVQPQPHRSQKAKYCHAGGASNQTWVFGKSSEYS